MGSVNNRKIAKPGGPKALTAEYRRAMPPGVGVWGAVTISREKLVAAKRKPGKSPAQPASPARR